MGSHPVGGGPVACVAGPTAPTPSREIEESSYAQWTK